MKNVKGQTNTPKMSQQHIPQPNSQSAAPAEVFDSTADAPHGQTVSALGTPGPRPGEVAVHTGQRNSLDFSIDRQFIPIDTFIWSTSQPRGTLLWYSPVHPSRVNPLIDYISGIYNTWGGGIEYNFKVAGTGFHAGALAFVRIPPNIHPNSLASPTEWGAFEYVVMDPKTLEVLSIDVMDQRQLNFHFMKLDEDNPQSFGGYIACFVLIPLNTSSTGTQQIAIQAFGKPGATFTMNQIIMPGIKENQAVEPILLVDSLLRTINQRLQQTLTYPSSLIVLGTEIQKFLMCYTANLNGDQNTDFKRSQSTSGQMNWKVTAEPSTTSLTGHQVSNESLAMPDKNSTLILWSTSIRTASMTASATYHLKRVIDSGTARLESVLTTTDGWSGKPPGVDAIVALAASSGFTTIDVSYTDFIDADYFTIPSKDEVFFVYGANAGNIHDLQTIDFYSFATAGYFKNLIGKSGAILLDVIDIATNLNLMTVKMYYEGVMTTHKNNANKKLVDPTRFIFNSYALRTSPIPVTPTQLVNLLLLSSSSLTASNEVVD